MNRPSLLSSICALATALVLVSCGPNKNDFGSLEPGAAPAGRYRSNLEVPPDLVDTTSEELLANQQVQEPTQKVLPEIKNLDIERNDAEGWLQVNADADVVWEKLVAHWNSLGVKLVQADPKTGFMETDWVLPAEDAKDRSKGKFQVFSDVLGSLLGSVFDQATALDKYTIQLERRGDHLTRINVDHRGLKKIQTQEATRRTNEEFEWVETQEQPDKVKRALTSIAYGLNSNNS